VESDRIDFISAYCDRWCERCAFTARCSLFAVQAAEAMCGDFEEALELAVGTPRPASNNTPPKRVPEWIAEIESIEAGAPEIVAVMREHEAREEKALALPVARLSEAWSLLAARWLQAQDLTLSSQAGTVLRADTVLREAIEVAAHDAFLIHVKLMRALEGRLEFEAGESLVDDPVQNDWNGTAKLALICIERSEHAWRAIAQSRGDETPAILADQLRDLQGLVEAEFPNSQQFVRPGFDEPGN